MQSDDKGFEGSRVPRVSGLIGLRRDATESMAVSSGGVVSWAPKSVVMGFASTTNEIL